LTRVTPALLTIVRHGETPANRLGVWHGSTDTELTQAGREQALRAAGALAAASPLPTVLYSSPLRRARDTAAAITRALALEARLEGDLTEYHLGAFEGRSYRELIAEHRLFERMREDPDWRPGGGESARQVASRCAAALRRIGEAHRGERVVVVSHGGALALGLGLLLDGDPGAWRRVMDNCAITELTLEPVPALVSFNRVEHLEAPGA
jgi:broad specificity phosphatase PhoE